MADKRLGKLDPQAPLLAALHSMQVLLYHTRLTCQPRWRLAMVVLKWGERGLSIAEELSGHLPHRQATRALTLQTDPL